MARPHRDESFQGGSERRRAVLVHKYTGKVHTQKARMYAVDTRMSKHINMLCAAWPSVSGGMVGEYVCSKSNGDSTHLLES